MGLKSTTTVLGYQQITSLSASTALTVPVGATMALIVAETQAVRWRDDGTAPTATVGMPLATGTSLSYDGDLKAIRFIQQTASAVLNVSYYA
jgi:ABC-type nickel/cobalt efflux system permease component RcnA